MRYDLQKKLLQLKRAIRNNSGEVIVKRLHFNTNLIVYKLLYIIYLQLIWQIKQKIFYISLNDISSSF